MAYNEIFVHVSFPAALPRMPRGAVSCQVAGVHQHPRDGSTGFSFYHADSATPAIFGHGVSQGLKVGARLL